MQGGRGWAGVSDRLAFPPFLPGQGGCSEREHRRNRKQKGCFQIHQNQGWLPSQGQILVEFFSLQGDRTFSILGDRVPPRVLVFAFFLASSRYDHCHHPLTDVGVFDWMTPGIGIPCLITGGSGCQFSSELRAGLCWRQLGNFSLLSGSSILPPLELSLGQKLWVLYFIWTHLFPVFSKNHKIGKEGLFTRYLQTSYVLTLIANSWQI